MTEDARNSVYLWVGAWAFFGLFWAALHFGLLERVPDGWLWPLVGVVGLVNIAQIVGGFWKRRASNANNPNNR